jgi:maspardin
VGSGPVLLLIPGTLGRGDIFWQQITALKDRMRILAVTYPSTGGVADWSSDLVTLMDRMGVERATVLDRRWVDIWRSILRPTHLHG